MQYLWDMIAAQQLVILLPLFNIELPESVGVVFQALMWVAAAEVIPTDPIYTNLFDATVEGIPLSPNFADIGLEHHLFLSNFGTLGFLLIFIVPLVYIVHWIMDKF